MAANAPRNRNWKAWIDSRPPEPPRLHVTGEVEVSAGNKEPVLTERVPPGINPTILILDLNIRDTGGVGTQAFQFKQVRFDKQDVPPGSLSKIEIAWQGATIVAIDDIEETH